MSRFACQILVVLLVITGLQARVLADTTQEANSYHHAHPHDHPCHEHDVPQPCDSSHDDHSPENHHHHHDHGCCGSGIHLIDARDSNLCLTNDMSQLLRISHEREIIPEGPYLSMDQPPLI